MKPSKLVRGKQYWVPNRGKQQLMTFVGWSGDSRGTNARFYLFQPPGSNHPGNRIGLAPFRVEEEVHEPHQTKPKYTQLAMELA